MSLEKICSTGACDATPGHCPTMDSGGKCEGKGCGPYQGRNAADVARETWGGHASAADRQAAQNRAEAAERYARNRDVGSWR